MHRFVLVLLCVLAVLLPAPLKGVDLILPLDVLSTSISITEYMAATDECEGAFQKLYKSRKKRPLLDVLDDISIAFLDIPDIGGQPTVGATVPPLSPRVMALDIFWVSMQNPVDTAKTILHELVHLLDFSYLPEKEWVAFTPNEREVRAEKASQICYDAFIGKVTENTFGK